MTHLIFYAERIDRHAGGPSGYLWHLTNGLKLNDAPWISTMFDESSLAPKLQKKSTSLIDRLRLVPFFWRYVKSFGPSYIRGAWQEAMTTPLFEYTLNKTFESELSIRDFQSVHCHSTLDALKMHNSLSKLGKRENVKLWLTSHCPEIPAQEKRDWFLSRGLLPNMAARAYSQLVALDLAAFSCADGLVFPCAEAMEPYLETCSEFSGAIMNKQIRFLFTGIVDPAQDKNQPLAISDPSILRLGYIGRHNEVKGYDILCKAIPDFLDSHNANMTVAGEEGPLYSPRHHKWTELGRIPGAHHLLNRLDALLLPNKRTYFDIVAIEAMAFGVPLLASQTGGNKALSRTSEGVILFKPSVSGLLKALEDFAALTKSDLALLGAANRRAYDKHFSAHRFGEAYKEIFSNEGHASETSYSASCNPQ